MLDELYKPLDLPDLQVTDETDTGTKLWTPRWTEDTAHGPATQPDISRSEAPAEGVARPTSSWKARDRRGRFAL